MCAPIAILACTPDGESSDAAVGWLEQAVQTDPDHARFLLNLGMALQLEQRTAEAITVLRRAVSLDPQLGEAWNNLGFVLAEHNMPIARRVIISARLS